MMKHLIPLLKSELKIPTDDRLVVSVSGGVDSMVLLSILKEGPYKLAVVHFNHLKRDQSVIEKDLVQSYCKTHDIPFYYYKIKVKDGNFHHQAHLLRTYYLNEVARLYKTPYILTAHHLDDLFESILIKITRGSNLLGYSGMQVYHDDGHHIYIKPLLYSSKKDIIEYAKKFDVPYLEDESNERDLYLRNRYRHAVVPIMKQENENLLEQIKQYHLQLSQAFSYIRNQTILNLKGSYNLDIPSFKKLDQAIKDDMIAYLIESHDLTPSYEIIMKVKRMLESKRPNQNYRLSKDYVMTKSYNNAFIEPLSRTIPIRIEVKNGLNKIDNNTIFTFLPKTKANTENFTKLCYNKLAFPLWLRHREDGDNLSYMYGHKKLKKLLIDRKVPTNTRNSLWVLVDSNQTVLWVEDYYLNQTLGNENEILFELKRGK